MLKIALAQINPTVGAIDANCKKIIVNSRLATNQGADVIVFPELTLTGYPPEDLLLKPSFIEQCHVCLNSLKLKLPKDIVVVIGMPWRKNKKIYNMALALSNGKIIAKYAKQYLPNYGVFDERRYFCPSKNSVVFKVKGKKCTMSICEDLWIKKSITKAKQKGAEYIFHLNASPYQVEKPQLRLKTMRKNSKGLNLVYVNQVGGQDELVFDGGSFMLDADGNKTCQLDNFSEQLKIATKKTKGIDLVHERFSEIYQALVLGTKDYVLKNGFSKVVLGLSGGIDSALTLCIAHSALGASNVEVVMMPSRYNLDISLSDAKKQAQILNVNYLEISIEPMFKSFLANLDFLDMNNPGVEQENLQARIRGMILMARSNQTGAMLLTTGNKSEMSVGYATLYGDMAGGFAPLKDVYKTTVFQLANWLNRKQEIIPKRVITRPPSAELSSCQKDSDSLPDYDLLDHILNLYIEHDKSRQEIIKLGLDETWVNKIARMVDISEYKRRQAPPGVKISRKNYGKDRRFPITNNFNM